MQQEGGALLVLDGGDALFSETSLGGRPDAEALRGRARLIARTLAATGAAAVNLSRRDLAAGTEFALTLGAELGVPWVSANLRLADGSSPVPRRRMVETAGVRVLITGVLPPDPVQDSRNGVQVLAAADAVRAVLEEARSTGPVDLVVCLSTLGMAAEQSLAEAVPGIHLIIGGGDAQRLQDPKVVGDTAIFHAADRGRFVGIVELQPEDLPDWRSPFTSRMRLLLEQQQTTLQNTLTTEQDQQRKAALQAQRDSVIHRLQSLQESAGTRIEHRLVALSLAITEDPEVAAWVAAWKQTPNRNKRVIPRRAPSPPRGPAPTGPQASAAGLHAGTGTCRSCHPSEYQAWARTPHARSYAALRDKPRSQQCLECHAARLQRAGGMSLEPIVGCESCHGPGGRHSGPGGIVRQPAEATCTNCHRGHHPEEAFDYAAGYRSIRCDR